MIHYDYYADVPRETIDRFVCEIELGRLVTVNAERRPHIGLYPFVYEGDTIEIHLVRTDEQITDLAANSQCIFEVDEVLGVIPSYWIDPEDAAKATAYHRTVIFECDAELSQDPEALVQQQIRLLARYQPEGGFRPIRPDDFLYRKSLAFITAVRLHVRQRRAKFKLAQNRSTDDRARIVRKLRERARPNDARAANAVQWTIEHEIQRPGGNEP